MVGIRMRIRYSCILLKKWTQLPLINWKDANEGVYAYFLFFVGDPQYFYFIEEIVQEIIIDSVNNWPDASPK